jgi:hypothetical protein
MEGIDIGALFAEHFTLWEVGLQPLCCALANGLLADPDLHCRSQTVGGAC